MVGFYNLSVIATYACLLSSCCGAYCALNNNIPVALIFLIISGVLDASDGAIASLVKRNNDERCFGIQIDSLCDSFCFGVLPAIIAYSIGMNSAIELIILFLFILAGIIRLAFYNVQEHKKLLLTLEGIDPKLKLRAKDLESYGKSYCFGLPITVIAFTLPSFVVIGTLLTRFIPSCADTGLLLWAVRIVMTCSVPAMLIKFRITKPGTVGKIIIGILALLLCVGITFLFV